MRGRAPSHSPQQFETRYGECRIEQGVVRLDQGIARLVRRYVGAIRKRDIGALGKGGIIVFGFVLTAQQAVGPAIAAVTAARDTIYADPMTGTLAVFAFCAACYPLVRRWRASHGPAEIHCSEIRSIEQHDREFHIEYEDGPETRTRTIETPKDDSRGSDRAREAFEEKGFEVERV